MHMILEARGTGYSLAAAVSELCAEYN